MKFESIWDVLCLDDSLIHCIEIGNAITNHSSFCHFGSFLIKLVVQSND